MTDKYELPDSLKSATRDQWRGLVEKSLNGKTIDQALTYKTYDGIEIKPLYTQDDVTSEAGSAFLKAGNKQESAASTETNLFSNSRPWQILQLTDIPSLKSANKQIKIDLDGGASGLYLAISNDIPFASAELPIYSGRDYETLFDGVDVAGRSIYFTNGREAIVNAANFVSYLKGQESDLSKIEGSFGFDPLSIFACMGSFPEPEDEALDNWLDAAMAIKDSGSKMSSFTASGRTWQQAGGSEAMELGYTLATALTYLRGLTKAGLSIDEALTQVDISLTTNGDIFLSTAKLRAMRLLWSKICEESGAKTKPTKFIAEMSYLGLTKADPEVNMLRATAATVAAGLGNVDALVLLPFSAAHGVANQDARRLALNTQIISQEESHIGQVEDPAAGSWYVESLTNQLAEKAWDIFQQTEKLGGMAKCLKSGHVKSTIDQVREAQINDIATGKKEITGVTTFPNINETTPNLFDEEEEWEEAGDSANMSVPVLNAPVVSGEQRGARFNDIIEQIKQGTPTYILDEALEGPATLVNMLGDLENRIMEDVEFLRKLSDEVLALNGKRPNVFLANIGRPADFTARATWAKSYFETGGIEALGNDGFANNEDLIEAYKTSGSTIACLCSSDKLYEQDAVQLAKDLYNAGAEAIYIIARPKFLKSIDFEDRSLFQTLLYQGTDMVSTLVEIHQIIGFADETVAV
ncbi:MAG: methylmalonyl-CoA mutase family protein [Rhodomicrobiaceae bacterium]